MKLRLLLIVTLVSLAESGCGIGPQVITKDPYGYSVSRTFESDFDTTWRAIIESIEWYPIITIEKDSGILVTDWVNGQSPNILRKNTFGGATEEYGIGVMIMKIEADQLLIIDVLEGGPADKAGVRKGDAILAINEARVTSTPDFNKKLRNKSEAVVSVHRNGAKEPMTFRIMPQKFSVNKGFIPVEAMYRLNIRASREQENQTEVKIINHEKADLGYYSGHGWISNYLPVPTATIREKEILALIRQNI